MVVNFSTEAFLCQATPIHRNPRARSGLTSSSGTDGVRELRGWMSSLLTPLPPRRVPNWALHTRAWSWVPALLSPLPSTSRNHVAGWYGSTGQIFVTPGLQINTAVSMRLPQGRFPTFGVALLVKMRGTWPPSSCGRASSAVVRTLTWHVGDAVHVLALLDSRSDFLVRE